MCRGAVHAKRVPTRALIGGTSRTPPLVSALIYVPADPNLLNIPSHQLSDQVQAKWIQTRDAVTESPSGAASSSWQGGGAPCTGRCAVRLVTALPLGVHDCSPVLAQLDKTCTAHNVQLRDQENRRSSNLLEVVR